MCPALSSLYSSWRDYSWSPLHPQKWPSLEDTLYRHLDPGHSSAAGVSLRQHLPPHCSPGQLPVCPTKVPARPRCYPQALPGRSSLGSSLFWINISTIGIHSGFLGLPLFFSQIDLSDFFGSTLHLTHEDAEAQKKGRNLPKVTWWVSGKNKAELGSPDSQHSLQSHSEWLSYRRPRECCTYL